MTELGDDSKMRCNAAFFAPPKNTSSTRFDVSCSASPPGNCNWMPPSYCGAGAGHFPAGLVRRDKTLSGWSFLRPTGWFPSIQLPPTRFSPARPWRHLRQCCFYPNFSAQEGKEKKKTWRKKMHGSVGENFVSGLPSPPLRAHACTRQPDTRPGDSPQQHTHTN